MAGGPQDPIVIVGMARTAMGGFQGAFAPLTAPQLGSAAIKAAVERAGTKLEDVSEVLMGCVLPAGQGQAPARQAALGAGLPNSVPCTTVNKMCGSGMKTVMMAYEALHARPTDIMVAGGMESMTNAPYLLPKMRAGARLGHAEVKDHMFLDGLEDAYDKGRLMGTFAEECAQSYQFTREAQDAFAIESLKRSKAANEDGSFAKEIVPVAVKTRYRFRRGRAGRAAVHGRPGQDPQAQAGLPRRRHSHCRQLQLDLGWGGGARADARERGEAAQARCRFAKISGVASVAQAPALFTTAPVGAVKKLLEGSAGTPRKSASTRSTRPSRSSPWLPCAISVCRTRR